MIVPAASPISLEGLFFFMSTSLMSRLALNIMLLQRSGIIDICLILIYSLYEKKILASAAVASSKATDESPRR